MSLLRRRVQWILTLAVWKNSDWKASRGSLRIPCTTTFGYYVVGDTVFAYSKDKLGFEKLKEIDRRVVGEIRGVPSIESTSKNVCERHFLSLSDVYSIAKVGCRLKEEISDTDYQLFNKQQESTPITPAASSQDSRHLQRENSDIPPTAPGSQTPWALRNYTKYTCNVTNSICLVQF